jgi:rSAM/selenodomain-associated transferase 1
MTGNPAAAAAVVIMAKAPVAGRSKTRLSPPLAPSEAAGLSLAMLQDTVALVSRVRDACLALAISPPEAIGAWRPDLPAGALLVPTGGADLGACLSEATGFLFAAGHNAVIALNSDGPTLPAGRIEQAGALLERADVVLGPSEDGGYYLVGLRRPCPGLFAGIVWSSARVLEQTVERAASLGMSVAMLAPWYDVDTPADLARLVRELAELPADALVSTRRFLAGRSTGAGAGSGTDRSRTPPSGSLDGETPR